MHRPKLVTADDGEADWLVYVALGCDEVWYSGLKIADESVEEIAPSLLYRPVGPEAA